MTIRDAYAYTCHHLNMIYDESESRSIAKILFEDRYDVRFFNSEDEFEEENDLKYEVLVRLKKREPIQYVTGRADFFGLQFKVNQHTLIPRPETEELVHWVLSDYRDDRRSLDVLDIGSGSGCIPITLKSKKKSWRLFGLDLSLDAVNTCLINTKLLKSPVQMYNFDFLDDSQWSYMGKFDIIVSNPPYIAHAESEVMSPQVLDYEPKMALFPVGDDPLIFYKKIVEFSYAHLVQGGALYVEINEYLPKETLRLFESAPHLGQVELKKDMQKKPRMIKAIRIGS